ncbi:MAG: Haloalkane dehalogenase [Alphaproteobacteria bacterium MarineAlpha2_Bin1]|nr:MAG: Haloalkane dehalogenase [Alphaproteobacteria bacterium MarineAlpha2_Bin1]
MNSDVCRGFINIDEGQIHYRTYGSENNPPLVMLHGSPLSAFAIESLIISMGKYFKVYAPDTIGNGDSCAQGTFPVTIEYLADAMLRAMSKLNLSNFYLYGFHTGGNIGIEAAIKNPKMVKKLIIDGLGLYDEDYKKKLIKNQAPEIQPDHEGTQFLKAWHLIRDGKIFWPWWNRTNDGSRGLGLPSEIDLHNEVMELLKSITTYHHNYRAALDYNKKPRLKLIKIPVLVMASENDILLPFLDEATKLIPGGQSAICGDPKTEIGREKTVEISRKFFLST